MKNPLEERFEELKLKEHLGEHGLLALDNYEYKILGLLNNPPMYDDLTDLLNIIKALANVTTLVQNTIIFYELHKNK